MLNDLLSQALIITGFFGGTIEHPVLNEPVTQETTKEKQTEARTQLTDLPKVERTGEMPQGSPEIVCQKMPKVWIYDGEAYDLTDFIKKHPGGEFFIGRMQNRDITTLVNIFHRNPQKVKKVLQKYSLGRKATPDDFHPTYNAPPFLFRDGFDGWRDTPKFNFEKPGQLLTNIRARLKEPAIKAKLDRMDALFDITTICLGCLYIVVQWLRLEFAEYMPIYVFVPLMAALRISLSGAGHYLIHRPQIGLTKLFTHIFDANYVPMAFVVIDGHSLMHHPNTQSEVDIKKNVFTAMMDLPRYYRLPLHTLHKLGHVLTGMLFRSLEICIYAFKYGIGSIYGSWQRGLLYYIGMLAMRIILLGELILFWQQGDFIAWLAQFIVTTWISTFMIVASHDFEEEKIAVNNQDLDWAVFQIENSYDLSMVGNKYIDCFLSAGLSPHRVHHVLPDQKSGFANIASEDIVREEAEKFKIVWHPPKNFFIDRLPIMTKHYLFRSSRLAKEKNLNLIWEHFHPQALRASVDYLFKGLVGFGSI
jgi:hypothetical protein